MANTLIEVGDLTLTDVINILKGGQEYSVKLSDLAQFITGTDVYGANFEQKVTTLFSKYLVLNKQNSSFKKLLSGDYTANLQLKYGFAATSTSPDFYDAVANDIKNRDYSRIEDGDIMYMPVTWNGATVKYWMVLSRGHYDGVGDIGSGPGIVLRALTPFGTMKMNNDNNNQCGWRGCKVRHAFNEASPTAQTGNLRSSSTVTISKTVSGSLNAVINTACNGHLRKIHRYLGNAAAEGSTYPDRNWLEDYAFLPQETEVFGTNHWANTNYYSTGVMFSAYAKAPHRRIVYTEAALASRADNGRCWYWIADAATVYGSTAFCNVLSYLWQCELRYCHS